MSDNMERREEEVRLYLVNNAKFFDQSKVPYVREKLMSCSDQQFMLATSTELKDPTMMLIISILVGTLGIDRFMLGDTGMGILKLVTGGLCGILTIIDWFGIQNKTKEFNLQKISMAI
ncbi:TM2 domain-containing protein [Miniphocaeibacter massiliensis]|uniref:TM2 domain-containing protein n=1 Tax=Miniphocaeibacter massiliensis TaxID=2041841 RepID=UPI001F5DF5A8|nr:TM2 domain-containing protein [Miniphocaeibacter massiliensis]